MLQSVVLTSTSSRGGRLKASGRLVPFFHHDHHVPAQVPGPVAVAVPIPDQTYSWDWFACDSHEKLQPTQQDLNQRQDQDQYQDQDNQLHFVLQPGDSVGQVMIPVSPHQGQFPGTPGSSSSESFSQRTASVTASGRVSSSQNQQTKKRTRASKPKVRTGCITCKIRRVKCGEEKPACLRCTSTGRVCDGYDTEATAPKKLPPPNQLLVQHRSRGLQPAVVVANPAAGPSSSTRPTVIAASGVAERALATTPVVTVAAPVASAASVSSSSSSPPPITAFHPSPATPSILVPGLSPLQPVRPMSLTPEIDLTDIEKKYLSEFTSVAEEGLSQHVSNLDEFWKWTVPRMCMQDRTVRHAIVALGAALRIYRDGDGLQSGAGAIGGGAASQQSEVVMLEHYGHAMALLRHADLDSPGVMTLALVCCLAFVYIESLRNNWGDALKHLRSGLSIINTIPLETLQALADPLGCADLPGPANSLGREMDCILRAFATLESSACLYTSDFEPIIALKLYHSRNLSEDIGFPEFTDIKGAHRAVAQFCRDVFALSWIWQRDPSGAGGGTSPLPAARRDVLCFRASRLEDRLQQFYQGPNSPKSWGIEYMSMLMDKLHFTCCKDLCNSLSKDTSLPPMSPAAEYLGSTFEDPYEDIVKIAESIKRGVSSMATGTQQTRRFMIDIGIVCPLHFVVCHCRDESMRERALNVLQDWPRKENLWDGPEVVRLWRTAAAESVGGGGRGGAVEDLPRSLSMALAIPPLREKFGRLSFNDDDDEDDDYDEYDEEDEEVEDMVARKRGRPSA